MKIVKKVLTSIANSFKFAFEGLNYALKTQKNLHIHLLIAFLILILSIWLKVSTIELAVILTVMMIVISLELVNSALESLVDLVCSENHYLAKISKDVGAAAVLFSAIASIAIGLIILGPKLLERLEIINK